METPANVPDRDPGLVEERGITVFLNFRVYSSVKQISIKTFAQPTDKKFNRLRLMMKETL